MPVANQSKVLATGIIGPRGSSGLNGIDAQDPSLISGRSGNDWIPVLPVTGGVLSGGIGGAATSIYLYGDSYQITNVASRRALISNQQVDFYSNSQWSLRLRMNEIWLSQDGWRVGNVDTDSANEVYYNWASQPLVSGARLQSGTRVHSRSHIQSTGDLYVGSHGIVYANVYALGIRFAWSSQSRVIVRVNNDANASYYLDGTCDERAKENISESTYDCLSTLRKIRLYSYRWKDQSPKDLKLRPASRSARKVPVGFIAQRLYEDFEFGVVGPDANEKALWNADHNTMLALLVGVVKQLDAEITELEERKRQRESDRTIDPSGNPA